MTLGSSPEARHAQALDALAYANETRVKRAAILKKLTRGETTVEEVLDNEWCQKATVYDIIRRQHRWGRQRALRLLKKVGIPEAKQVGTLSLRQRAELLTQVRIIEQNRRRR